MRIPDEMRPCSAQAPIGAGDIASPRSIALMGLLWLIVAVFIGFVLPGVDRDQDSIQQKYHERNH